VKTAVKGVAVATDSLVACDLDQTLIYSRAAFRLPAGTSEPALRIVEYLAGQPLSYTTEAAATAVSQLAEQVTVVPVTTRTLAQYRRVDLGFSPAYAIAANGGHLLVRGEPDARWGQAVRQRLDAAGLPLAEVRTIAERVAAAPWVRTLRDADDLFIYLVATERAAIPDLRELAATLAAAGWTLSIQGRKVYLVPAALTKEAALGELMGRTGAGRLLAAGDSLLDLGMLSAADTAIRPAHGELHEQAVDLPQLRVTRRAGLLGGEDVVDLLGKSLAEARSFLARG
jgi:phosphoserine phosphatase